MQNMIASVEDLMTAKYRDVLAYETTGDMASE